MRLQDERSLIGPPRLNAGGLGRWAGLAIVVMAAVYFFAAGPQERLDDEEPATAPKPRDASLDPFPRGWDYRDFQPKTPPRVLFDPAVTKKLREAEAEKLRAASEAEAAWASAGLRAATVKRFSGAAAIPPSRINADRPLWLHEVSAQEVVVALRHPDAKVRQGALVAAAGRWLYAYSDHVTAAVRDESPEVRLRAVESIAFLRVHRAIPALVLQLKDEKEPALRRAILQTLYRLTFHRFNEGEVLSAVNFYGSWWEEHEGLSKAEWIEFDLEEGSRSLAGAWGEDLEVLRDVLFQVTLERFPGFTAMEVESAVKAWRTALEEDKEEGGGYNPVLVAFQGFEVVDAEVQAAAGQLLARLDEPKTIPLLLERLRHVQPGTQEAASIALKAIARKDLPFHPGASLQQQEKEIRAWEDWLHAGAKPDFADVQAAVQEAERAARPTPKPEGEK